MGPSTPSSHAKIGSGGGAVTAVRAAPLRPLGVAEILDGAVRLTRRNARATFSVSVPFAIVASAANAMSQRALLNSADVLTFTTVATLLLAITFGTVLTGLLAPLFASDLLGAPITVAETLHRVGRRVWPLIALGLLVTIAEGAGLVACLVGGVWLWGLWAVAAPAMTVEATGVRGALRRSRTLVSGTFWRVWGIRALGWVLTSVLGLLIELPFLVIALVVTDVNPFDTAGGVSGADLYVIITSIGTLMSTAILRPIAAGIDVMLYTDLRMRKEGMDIVLGLPAAPSAMTSW
jgi:hypothetical protein